MKQIFKKRFRWFRLIVFAIVAYFVYWGFVQQANLQAIYHEAGNTRQKLEQANQTNAALIEEKNRLNDKQYIEKLAREELGLVKPGETPIVSVPNN